MKDLFNVKIENQTPIVETEFYQWLSSQFDYGKRRNKNDIDLICQYLNSIGFDIECQRVSEDALDYLQIVIRHYFEMRPRNPPARISELFDLEHSDENGRYIVGVGRKDLTEKGLQYLKNCDMFYGTEGVYFQIINNYLFAKYNQIIGSRKVCELLSE